MLFKLLSNKSIFLCWKKLKASISFNKAVSHSEWNQVPLKAICRHKDKVVQNISWDPSRFLGLNFRSIPKSAFIHSSLHKTQSRCCDAYLSFCSLAFP